MQLLKIAFITLFTFKGIFSHAQLPLVYAQGGEGRNIDWESIKKEYQKNTDENELPFFYNDCLMEFTVTTASSILPAQGSKDYKVKNLSDEDPTTAWIPDSKHYGIGESFEISSSSLNVIYNGYQTNPVVWNNNSRVKKFKVYQDNTPLCFLQLTDEMGAQSFQLPLETGYSEEPKSIFRFEIAAVYPGAKYQDVAISEIAWSGCCFARNTSITTGSYPLAVHELQAGQNITTLDIATGNTKETKILKTAHQKHLNLLIVSTANRSITITADHPLYVKGHGFISCNKLKKIVNAKNYADLVSTTAVLVWNAETGKQEYEPLTSITIEKSLVNTYTIRKLSQGTVFIANGFVTTTY